MSTRVQDVALASMAGALGLVTIAALNLLARPPVSSPLANPGRHQSVHSPSVTRLASQRIQANSELGASSNVLELPAASLGFVGHWGGFIHDAGFRINHDSGHIALVFGRQTDKVFFASQVFSPAGQRVLRKPRVRIVSPREVVIRYESEDWQIDYVYAHRFRLLDSSRMEYRETVYLYAGRGRRLFSVVERRALLKRLTTLSEWLFFARPAPGDIREGEVSAKGQFPAPR